MKNNEELFAKADTGLNAPVTTWREERVARAYWNAALRTLRKECPPIIPDAAYTLVVAIEALSVPMLNAADVDGISEARKRHD